MSKIVRVQDGNYKLIVGSESSVGYITLDTNPSGEVGAQGKVTITGDLEVLGNTTTVESETLAIKDNVIYINVGEQQAGVSTLGPTSGLQVDRGTLPDVSILWDERVDTFVFVNSNYINPVTDLSTAIENIAAKGVLTGGRNLQLVGSGTGIVTVTGTVNYERQVLNYDLMTPASVFQIISVQRTADVAEIIVNGSHGFNNGDLVDIQASIPSLSATAVAVTVIDIDTFRYTNPGPNIDDGALTPGPITYVPGLGGTARPYFIRNDDTVPNIKAVADYVSSSLLTFTINKIIEGDSQVIVTDSSVTGVSQIKFDVDNVTQAIINNNGLNVDSIRVNDDTISNWQLGPVKLDSVTHFKNRADTPAGVVGYVGVYSRSSVDLGNTGLYFANPNGTNDELISKTRSLLFSLIL